MLDFNAVQQAGMARMRARMQAMQGLPVTVPPHVAVIHPLVHTLVCANDAEENILLTSREAGNLGMTLHRMAAAIDELEGQVDALMAASLDELEGQVDALTAAREEPTTTEMSSKAMRIIMAGIALLSLSAVVSGIAAVVSLWGTFS